MITAEHLRAAASHIRHPDEERGGGTSFMCVALRKAGVNNMEAQNLIDYHGIYIGGLLNYRNAKDRWTSSPNNVYIRQNLRFDFLNLLAESLS